MAQLEIHSPIISKYAVATASKEDVADLMPPHCLDTEEMIERFKEDALSSGITSSYLEGMLILAEQGRNEVFIQIGYNP